MPIYEYRVRQLFVSIRSETEHQGRRVDHLRAMRQISSPPHLLVGPHVQRERLVCDRLFEQAEAAVRRRENSSRGRREERDSRRILDGAAGESVHRPRERLLEQRTASCQPVHAEHIEHVEQIISRAR